MNSGQDLQTRARHQEAIATLSRRAIAGQDIQALHDDAVHLIAGTLGVELVKVLELMPDGDSLLLRAGVGWHDGLMGEARVGAGLDSQAGYTLFANRAMTERDTETHEPIIVEDLLEETRFTGPALLHDHGVVSGVSVIIYGADKPYGVLGAHTTQRRHFTAEEADFLQVMANVLATALQRYESERAVRENEARLKAVIDTAAEGIVTIDSHGIIHSVNPLVETMFGYAAEELLGRNVNVLMPEPHRTGHDGYIARYLATGDPKIIGRRRELEGLRRDGTRFPLELAVTESVVEGEPLFTGMLRDITHERQAREELERARRWFEHLTIATPDAVFVFDLPKREIVYINHEILATLGYTSAELQAIVTEEPQSFLHSDEWDSVGTFFARLKDLRDDEVWGMTCRCLNKEKAYRWFQTRFAVFERDSEGHVQQILGVSRDISQLQETREALAVLLQELAEANDVLETRVQERTAELERQTQQLRRLTSELVQAEQRERTRIAHLLHDDVQQLLVAANMRIDLAARRAPDTRPWSDVKALTIEAIDSIRSLAKRLHPPAMHSDGLPGALEWLAAEMKEQYCLDFRLSLAEMPRPLPEPVQVLLFHAARELAFNAVKHSRADNVDIALACDDGQTIRLRVSDSGRGCDTQDLDGNDGGFGLFSIREQVVHLGGEFTLTTERGQGFAVEIAVPAALAPDEDTLG